MPPSRNAYRQQFMFTAVLVLLIFLTFFALVQGSRPRVFRQISHSLAGVAGQTLISAS